DEDLVAAFQRLKVQHPEDMPDLRDLDLSRLIFHRNDRHIRMDSRFDFPASRALAAKVSGGRVEAVQRLRDHESTCVFAHALRARENHAVRKPPFAQFRSKPFDDLPIADKRIELHQSNPSSVSRCRWTTSIVRSA